MSKGKHHSQAVCACATHLLDRVFAVLREGRAYELRDVDGQQVSRQAAREIIAERYKVPEEVRRRRNVGQRRERAVRASERQQQKQQASPGAETRGPSSEMTSTGA